MPAKENSSLLSNSAAVDQQAPFRGTSAQTGKTISKPFAARSSVVPTIQAILDISWITDPKVWLGQGSTAPGWKEDAGYNLHRWGDLMEVMEVNSSSSSIGTCQQQQQQQAPNHLRPVPRGQAPAYASIRSNGQWKNNNAKGGGNYTSNRQQQQQQQAWGGLRPAPRVQAPAHASIRSNGQWKNNNAKGGGNLNSNRQKQQQQQAWGGLRLAYGYPALAGMDGWSVVSRRK